MGSDDHRQCNGLEEPVLDNTSALNGYAWFWALEEKNLKSALNAQLKAVEVDPDDDNLYDT